MNITGPRTIFTSLFTPSIYFQFLLSIATVIISCIDKAGGIDNSSVLVGSKVICICVQVQVKEATFVLKTVPLFPCQLLDALGVLLVRYSTLASLLREICCYATSNLPLGVTNEESFTARHQANYWHHCGGLQSTR